MPASSTAKYPSGVQHHAVLTIHGFLVSLTGPMALSIILAVRPSGLVSELINGGSYDAVGIYLGICHHSRRHRLVSSCHERFF